MVKNNYLKDIEEVQDTAFRVSLKIVKNPADVEDVLQESMLKILEAKVPAEVEIKAWYLKLVINASLNLYKKKKNAKSHSQRVCLHKKGLKEAKEIDFQQLLKEVELELNNLPDQYKLPIYLRYFEGLEIPQIALSMNINERHVRTNIQRGIEKLRGVLSKEAVVLSAFFAYLLQSPPSLMACPTEVKSKLSHCALNKQVASFATKSFLVKLLVPLVIMLITLPFIWTQFVVTAIDSSVSYKEYYLSPSGNDANAGGKQAPWRTLQKANESLLPGEKVFMASGVYEGVIAPVHDGESDEKRIVYGVLGDGVVRVKQAVNTEDHFSGSVILSERKFITVSGLIADSREIFLSIEPAVQSICFVSLQGANGCLVEGLAMRHNGEGNLIRGVIFGLSSWSTKRATSQNVLRKCRIFGVLKNEEKQVAGTEDLISMQGNCHHNLVEENYLENCMHSGVYDNGGANHRNVYRRNTVVNKHHNGIDAWSSGFDRKAGAEHLFEENIVIGTAGTESPLGGAGNAFQFGADELIIRNNIIGYGGGAGDHNNLGGLVGATSTSDGDPYFATDGRIYHNTFYKNNGMAIGIFDFEVGSVDLGRHVFVNNVVFGTRVNEFTGLITYWDQKIGAKDVYSNNYFGPESDRKDFFYDTVNGKMSPSVADLKIDKKHGPMFKKNQFWVDDIGLLEQPEYYFSLKAQSPLEDTGVALSQVSASFGSSVIHVEDVRFFFVNQQGEFPDWMNVQSDSVKIGKSFETAIEYQILEKDVVKSVLKLDRTFSGKLHDQVWLFRNSSGKELYFGKAPDAGALEVGR